MKAPESSWQAKLLPTSVAVKLKLAVLELLRAGGAAVMVVSGGVVSLAAVTVRAIVVVLVKVPDVPVIVTVPAPVVAVLLAVSVKVLVVVTGFGLKDAVTPLGRPDAEKLTLPLKPFRGVTVIVLVPLPPCVMVKLLGDAETV